jgi:hypothetical protein
MISSCVSPGASGNLASAVVNRAVEDARRGDMLRLIARIRDPTTKTCFPTVADRQVPLNRGDRTVDLVKRTVEAGVAPSDKVLSSGSYVENLVKMTVEKENDPMDPTTRFLKYKRYTPAAPCATYPGNPAVPVPSFKVCQPSRFY